MHPKYLIRLLRLLTIIIPAIVLQGCFGGGSAPAPIAGTAPGALVNSPVEGADYVTATQSGVTDINGTFRYMSGEMVTFSVGGIVLGTAAGATYITPVELTGSANPTEPAAINLMRFLQSIDADSNHANGITISAVTQAMAVGLTLDFATASDMEVDTVIGMLTNNVVDPATAVDNFYETYKDLGGTTVFSWPFPGKPVWPPPPVELLTNGSFESPVASGGDQGSENCFTTIAGSGWNCFNTAFITSNLFDSGNNSAPAADGSQNLKLFGPFFPFGGSGVFQEFPAVPNATYTASVQVQSWTQAFPMPDPMNPSNFASLQLVFSSDGNFNDNGAGETTYEEKVSTDPLTPDTLLAPDTWTTLTISRPAPADTVAVRLALVHVQLGTITSGTVWFDDASLIGPVSPASPPIFNTLVWFDEFVPNTSLDTNVWTLETGIGPNFDGWGNNEWQIYTTAPANVSIDTDPLDATNGHLRISALLDTINCPSPAPPPGGCGFQDGRITSARINTLPIPYGSATSGFAFQYGRIEASIKLPVGGYGTWPAFWMLGDRFNAMPPVIWPEIGEIDIVEMFGRGGTSNQEAVFTLHWCDETIKPPTAPVCFPGINPDNGYRFNSGTISLGEALGNKFRVYAAEWDANGVTWSIDGLTYRFTAIQPATMEEFLDDFFIILNVAIGGNPFGNFGTPASAPDDQGWPREMLVDWIRVYQ